MIEHVEPEQFVFEIDHPPANPDEESVAAFVLVRLPFCQATLIYGRVAGDRTIYPGNSDTVTCSLEPKPARNVVVFTNVICADRLQTLLAGLKALAIEDDSERRPERQPCREHPCQAASTQFLVQLS